MAQFTDDPDAIRAQIETLNAITAYYASLTERVSNRKARREFPDYVISAKQAAGKRDDILRKINDSPRFATGGVIYPTRVETINNRRGPEAAIIFAWSPGQPHHLSPAEARKLRDQLDEFIDGTEQFKTGSES